MPRTKGSDEPAPHLEAAVGRRRWSSTRPRPRGRRSRRGTASTRHMAARSAGTAPPTSSSGARTCRSSTRRGRSTFEPPCRRPAGVCAGRARRSARRGRSAKWFGRCAWIWTAAWPPPASLTRATASSCSIRAWTTRWGWSPSNALQQSRGGGAQSRRHGQPHRVARRAARGARVEPVGPTCRSACTATTPKTRSDVRARPRPRKGRCSRREPTLRRPAAPRCGAPRRAPRPRRRRSDGCPLTRLGGHRISSTGRRRLSRRRCRSCSGRGASRRCRGSSRRGRRLCSPRCPQRLRLSSARWRRGNACTKRQLQRKSCCGRDASKRSGRRKRSSRSHRTCASTRPANSRAPRQQTTRRLRSGTGCTIGLCASR